MAAAGTWSIDNSAPSASVQIRLRDGSRLVAKFNLTHTAGQREVSPRDESHTSCPSASIRTWLQCEPGFNSNLASTLEPVKRQRFSLKRLKRCMHIRRLIRLIDWLTGWLGHYLSVADIRAFIAQAAPASAGGAYTLQLAGFPPKQLTDDGQLVSDGLANSVVIQR